MRRETLVAFLFLMITSCKGNSQSIQHRTEYKFPNTSIVKTIPDECMSKEDDKLINTASDFESLLLNIAGDKVTLNDEKEYGAKFNEIFKKDMQFLKDNNLGKLQQILKKLMPFVDRKEIPYTITLVKNDKEINAWTHAGGYIYITTGLLDFIQSEDELAFCIAHEIGHNENNHCKASVQRIKTALNMGVTSELTNMASSVYSSVFAAFNQPQETASDLAGVYLIYKAGYDPSKALSFFDKLAKQEKQDALERMLRSHPYAAERGECLKNYLNNAVK